MSGPRAQRLIEPQPGRAGPGPGPPGQAPADEHGWRIVDIGRSLFPGGPRACHASSPRLSFFFGLELRPRDDGFLTAIVTNLGWPSLQGPSPNVLADPADLEEARARIRDYLLVHWRAFRSRRTVDVVFAPGDGRVVEVF